MTSSFAKVWKEDPFAVIRFIGVVVALLISAVVSWTLIKSEVSNQHAQILGLESRLEISINSVNENIDEIKGELSEELSDVKRDVKEVKNDVKEVKDDVGEVQKSVSGLNIMQNNNDTTHQRYERQFEGIERRLQRENLD